MSLPTDAQERKAIPVHTGFIRYFPRAIAAVAHLSYVANEQHNPGTPVHWDRSKSQDELDALMRHMLDDALGVPVDTDGVSHKTKVAWRAMADLEKALEAAEFQAKVDMAVPCDEDCYPGYPSSGQVVMLEDVEEEGLDKGTVQEVQRRDPEDEEMSVSVRSEGWGAAGFWLGPDQYVEIDPNADPENPKRVYVKNIPGGPDDAPELGTVCTVGEFCGGGNINIYREGGRLWALRREDYIVVA